MPIDGYPFPTIKPEDIPVGHLQDVIASADGLPVAAAVTDLHTWKVVAGNDKAAKLFGVSIAELVGDDVISRIEPYEQESARQAYAALENKVVDGLLVVRDFVTQDGKTIPLHVWGKRVESSEGSYGLWILVPGGEPFSSMPPAVSTDMVLALTDHDWQIEYMSSDASVLGVRGSELRGFPLLGLIHPTVAAEFLIAAGRASVENAGVTIATRMHLGSGGWVGRQCFLTRMCEHHPPRLGMVVCAGPSAAKGDRSELEGQVRQFALESRGLGSLSTLPALVRLPVGNELSARQTEIVSRLIAGEGVPQIARSMFLSQSTVRNHLASIYKKFGVHSQNELLASLLRAVASHVA